MSDSASSTQRSCERLRECVSDVFGFNRCSRVILTPGSLITLRLAFACIGTQRIMLGEDEYYTGQHFPEWDAAPKRASNREARWSVAEIKSLVTWKGRYSADFSFKNAGRNILRIIDASHAGAAGFPNLNASKADLIIGNPGHWLGRGAAKENLGFMYVANDDLWARLSATFRMFYLAVEGETVGCQSRWIDPSLLRRISTWLARHHVNRAQVRKQHNENMKLARSIASKLRLPDPETALIWSPERTQHRALEPFREAGLIWHPPGGGTRIMCRADLMEGK